LRPGAGGRVRFSGRGFVPRPDDEVGFIVWVRVDRDVGERIGDCGLENKNRAFFMTDDHIAVLGGAHRES
jgi:hypothetical protein